LDLSKLVSEIDSLGYPIQQIAYDKWQAKLLNIGISQQNESLASLFTEKISENS